MKKTLSFFIYLLSCLFGLQAFAQLPLTSTEDNPVWYYIQVVGGDDARKDLVFTAEGNDVYGRSIYQGGSLTSLSDQLWRFEISGNEYAIVHRTTGKKLSLIKSVAKEIVAAVLTDAPLTTWNITANSGNYNISAVTPLSTDAGSKYAHQMNKYGKRNFEIGFELERWKSDKNSLFRFIRYEDPYPVISEGDRVVWYYISSQKDGFSGKCITDTESENDARYIIGDKVENNDYQQWKLINKDATGEYLQFVNKATGNVIQTHTKYNEYYYTQAADNQEESNGWKLDYIGERQFEISGLHDDTFVRYLNAASSSEASETYIADKSQSTGFSWSFERVEAVTEYPSAVSGDNLFLTSVASQSSVIETMPSDLKYVPSSGYATSYQNNENIEKSYDGNMNTLYHSSYSSTTFPVTLTYNFTNVPQLDYLIYHPRPSGNNGIFKELEIWYTTQTEGRTKLGDYNFNGSASPVVVTFDEPLLNPTRIEFVVKSGVGNFASCAEMEFYSSNPDLDEVYELFEDRLLTQLKPEVTEEDINNISNIYIRDLAMTLYNQKYVFDFRVADYDAYLSMSEFSKLTNISNYSKYENPTGIYFAKGKHVVVAENIRNTPVSIVIPKYENQTTTKSLPSKKIPLKNGINIIDVGDWDGLGYINYYSDRPDEEEPVRIHAINGIVQGYFDASRHTNEDWVRLLGNANKYVIMDMLGRYSQVAFPVESYRKFAPTQGLELISAYDTIVRYEQRLFGYEKYNKNIRNHVLWRVNYNYYAYKDEDGCSFEVSYMNRFANYNFLNTMDVYENWTIVHELGHVHQFSFYNWHGMTEVTVNIPNVDIMHRMNTKTSRFPDSDFQKAYDNILVPGIAHASYFGDNYNILKLVPFAQLYHYYAENGNYDFYPELFEALRNTEGSTSSWTMADYEMNFAEKACDIAGLDLIPFFEKWGFFYYTNQDGRSPFDVGDYGGTKQYSLFKSKVDRFKDKMAAKGYPQPDEDISLVLPDGKRMQAPVSVENVFGRDYIVYSSNRRIIVEGTEDYIIRNISGMKVDNNSTLSSGIYFVTIKDKTIKIYVK